MHPYDNLPSHNFWRTGVAQKDWSEVNFKPTVKFKINSNHQIATGGSCFAQHIAVNLPKLGLRHFISEEAPSLLTTQRAAQLQYGVYSARYGNIYTARQLRQLIEFAFCLRERTHLAEETAQGWIDLLRPGVQSEGYQSFNDLVCDRSYHLDCVKKLFLESDCFIFTLGLTEAWYHSSTGIVFPVCPGTKAGNFDVKLHKFINFSVSQVAEDLQWCVDFMSCQNPQMKWIFTVSPVALAATATNQNVLIASSLSKAVLRSAVDEVFNQFNNCEYFPSFEITVGAASLGQFLNPDLRTISSNGVNIAMQVFQKTFLSSQYNPTMNAHHEQTAIKKTIKDAVNAECDEIFNDPTSNK